jgi:hypothetical protein
VHKRGREIFVKKNMDSAWKLSIELEVEMQHKHAQKRHVKTHMLPELPV